MISTVLFLLVATFDGVSASYTEQWALFVDPGGKFEMELPDSVQTEVSEVETVLGVLEYVNHFAHETLGNGQVTYALNYCDYPAGALDPDSTDLIDLFFAETIAGAVASTKGALIYSSGFAEDGLTGYIWKIATPEGIHIKNKAFLVGDRYYCLQVITSEELSVKNNGDRFLNSFNLLDT